MYNFAANKEEAICDYSGGELLDIGLKEMIFEVCV